MARWGSPVAAVLILAVIAGCSDSGRETGRDTDGSTTTVKRTSTTVDAPTTDTSSTTAPTTLPPEDQAVVAAYLAFWDRYVQIGSTPPPFDPAATRAQLAEFTSGDETTQLFDFFKNNATTGVVVRGDTRHSPTVESNDGTVAVVRDCMDDRTGAFRIADDSRIDTNDPARRTYVATLRLDGSTWKVAKVTTEPEPCTA